MDWPTTTNQEQAIIKSLASLLAAEQRQPQQDQKEAIIKGFEDAKAKEFLDENRIELRLGQRAIVPIKDDGVKELGKLIGVIHACVLVSNTAGGDVRFQVNEALVEECLRNVSAIELSRSKSLPYAKSQRTSPLLDLSRSSWPNCATRHPSPPGHNAGRDSQTW